MKQQPFEDDNITPDTDGSSIEQLAFDYAEAKADQAELVVTRQYLLKAISLLPRRELKVTLSEQADMAAEPFLLQAKRDDNGTVSFRAVKTFG